MIATDDPYTDMPEPEDDDTDAVSGAETEPAEHEDPLLPEERE